MTDLTKVYSGRIRNLGVEIEDRVHSARLKNRLLAYFPDIQEYKQWRENNIDHNPSATTAKDSFYGTGISLFQHMTSEEQGEQRINLLLQQTQCTKVTETLPESFASVSPAVLKTKVPEIPLKEGPYTGCTQDLQEAVQEEYRWLKMVANTQEDQNDEMSVVSLGDFTLNRNQLRILNLP
ncbi:unnamed protein product [Mytilus coruscus]|uniref:Uncharacterized protein n=1 Tax=Mytilus coruscus TaxID=42192 RepID=A0A6J8DZT3_MYTCO|nr:unnamed protein product [Mytilus coruscus]